MTSLMTLKTLPSVVFLVRKSCLIGFPFMLFLFYAVVLYVFLSRLCLGQDVEFDRVGS